MKTLEINHGNDKKTLYKLVENNTDLPVAYHMETPEKLIAILECIRRRDTRVKINFGDVVTGKSWNEEHDIFGRLGLCRGHKARFPILLYSRKSVGGGSLMDHCILKITDTTTKRVLYEADNFQESVFEIKESLVEGYSHSVHVNGEIYSNHKNEQQAKLLITKLK